MNLKLKLLIALTLALCCVLVAITIKIANTRSDNYSATLFKSILDKCYDGVSGTAIVTIYCDKSKKIDSAHFVVKGKKYRYEDGKTIMTSNGSVVWIYTKTTNSLKLLNDATLKSIDRVDYCFVLQNLLNQASSIKLSGKDTIDEHECLVFEITPKNNAFKDAKVWIYKKYPVKVFIDYGVFNISIYYKNISFNVYDSSFDLKMPDRIIMTDQHDHNASIFVNSSDKAVCVIFYSPYCPHCKAIEPLMRNLTKEFKNTKFVFCNIQSCDDFCKLVMHRYSIRFVPTAVVIGKNNTTILTGSTEIENELERVLNES